MFHICLSRGSHAVALSLSIALGGGLSAQALAQQAASVAEHSSDAVNEMLRREKNVVLPCGTFVVTETIRMPSGSSLRGAGDCTVLAASPSLAPSTEWRKIKGASAQTNMMVTNDDFQNGNSNFSISNLTVDASKYARKGHIFGFYKVSNVKISHVRFVGGRNPNVFDGVAFVNSKSYQVLGNVCAQVKTACFDNWGGNSDLVISGNKIEGAADFSSYGVLVNGINTDDTPNTTRNAKIVGNRISSVSQGIFVGGLRMKNGQHGAIENIIIRDNIIDSVDYHGIRVSDGHAVTVVENSVDGAGRNCLLVGSEGGGGQTDDISVYRNKFSGCASKDSNADAVTLYSGASNVKYRQNSIAPGAQRYSIRVDSTVSNSDIDASGTADGRLGGVSNSGRAVQVVRP